MQSINPKYIDVDFPLEKEYVFGDLGIPAIDQRRFTRFEDSIDIIPEANWKEMVAMFDDSTNPSGADRLVTRIYNQGGEGSCVANACSQAHEILQALQFGKQNVIHLSAISLYKRIGRSAQSGAMVGDGIEEMVEKGVVPLDDARNRQIFGNMVMPNTGFRESYPPGWEEVAKRFRGHEFYTVNSVNELMTALLYQFPVVVGRAGHSICYCRPVYDGNQLMVKYVNSWGNWGDNGYGYDSSRLFRSSASYAFVMRSVREPMIDYENNLALAV